MLGVSHYSLTCTSGPAAEPLTTAEAKAHLRVETDFTADDTLIDAMVTSARTYVEQYTGRQLITATWVLRMDAFPAVIEVPRPNLLTVTSVVYQNGSNVARGSCPDAAPGATRCRAPCR